MYGGRAALTASETVSAFSGNSPQTSGTFTPKPNDLLLMWAISYKGSGAAADPTIVDTTGLNWVVVTNRALTSTDLTLSLYRAQKSSGLSAGTVTLTRTGTWMQVMIMSIPGADTSGTDGSGAIVQTGAADDSALLGTAMSISISLSAFAANINMAVMGTFHQAKTITAGDMTTPGSGFTEVSDYNALDSINSAYSTIEDEWKINDATPSASWALGSYYIAVAAEIKAAQFVIPQRFNPSAPMRAAIR